MKNCYRSITILAKNYLKVDLRPFIDFHENFFSQYNQKKGKNILHMWHNTKTTIVYYSQRKSTGTFCHKLGLTFFLVLMILYFQKSSWRYIKKYKNELKILPVTKRNVHTLVTKRAFKNHNNGTSHSRGRRVGKGDSKWLYWLFS